MKPISRESIRIWCGQHDRAVEAIDKWPRLMPRRVADSPDRSVPMEGFERDGTWAVNLKAMVCDEGWSCFDDWKVSLA